MCGEKIKDTKVAFMNPGSPPRVRGKVGDLGLYTLYYGITPARAGKRPHISARNECPRDHPRACGEKSLNRYTPAYRSGLPPRMRGKDVRQELQHSGRGITPAYAGKSAGRAATPTRCRDHPRVCGEKVKRIGEAVCFRGITPACAGKSSIQHLTASLGEFEVQKGHPVPHLRQRLQVWPDHARHLRHGLIPHASRSAGQGRRLCPGPCPDTAGSGTPRGPSPAKRPHTSPPAATPGGCRAWQSGATAPGSR